MKWRLDIDQHAAPGKARLVFDRDGRGGESGGRDFDELKKSLQAAHHAECGRRREHRARVRDGEFVGFILAKFLHGLTAMVGVDLQRGAEPALGRNGIPVWRESWVWNLCTSLSRQGS